METWAIILGIATFLVVIWKMMSHGKRWENLPPGSLGLPFIGETVAIIKEKDFFVERHRKYGPIFKTHIFGKVSVFIAGNKYAKDLLTEEGTLVLDVYPNSTRDMLVLEKMKNSKRSNGHASLKLIAFGGSGSLCCSVGQDHTKQRKWLSKMFLRDALNSYIPIMREIITLAAEGWIKQDGVLLMVEGVRDIISNAAAAVIAGVHDEETKVKLKDNLHEFIENILVLRLNIPGSAYRRGMAARRNLKMLIKDLFENRDLPNGTILHHLKQNMYLCPFPKSCITEKVTDAVLELFFASNVTLNSALSMSVWYVLKFPDVKEKIAKERQLMGQEEDTVSSLAKYKYTKAVAKEVLRMSAPVPNIFRKLLKDYQVEGYTLPKGLTVGVSVQGTHMFSKNVSHPEEFRPERWLSGDDGAFDRFDFIPFGGGNRYCLGKEYAELFMVLFLRELSRLKIIRKSSSEDIKSHPVPVPADGLPVLVSL